MATTRKVASPRVAVLAALCAGMAWLFYSALQEPASPPDLAAQPDVVQAPVTLAAAETFTPTAIEAYADFVKRPLFAQSRRPPPALQDVQSRSEGLALALVGTIITGEKPYALIDPGNGQPVLHLGVGESADGWTITKIQPYAVAVGRGGEERQLYIRYEAVDPPRPAIARERTRPPPTDESDPAANSDS